MFGNHFSFKPIETEKVEDAVELKRKIQDVLTCSMSTAIKKSQLSNAKYKKFCYAACRN